MASLLAKAARIDLQFDTSRPGRIASLTSVDSGREWLWRNPALPPVAARYGQPYGIQHDVGGWDEIFPGVSEETVRWGDEAMDVQDHGDLITLPWTTSALAQGGRLDRVEGRCRDFVFERTIVAAEDGWDFHYTIQNRAARTFPWLYCSHPLFAVEPGMELTLADAAGAVVEQSTVPDPVASDFRPLARKRFSAPGRVSEVQLRSADGLEQLSLRFDAKALPFVGLWENYHGWHGAGKDPYFNLGIEPATAPHDNLSAALNDDSARWLEPDESFKWSLQLRLQVL